MRNVLDFGSLHIGECKKSKEKIHTMAAVMRALRRNSGKVGDVFTDVIQRTNLTVADDVS